jgi:N-acetylglucosaminyldiphosphoundecaprenol N-acetyl-beta-D-mannosaminyltransferase
MSGNAPERRPSETAEVAAALGSIVPDDFDRDVWCVLGIPIDNVDVPKAVVAIEAAVRDRRRLSFVTPNVNWLVRSAANLETRRQILNADLSLADGAPIVLMARLLGIPLKNRAAGADVFDALRLRPAFRGRRIRVFFFGGRNGSAERAFERLQVERGGLEAAGWLNPGHGDVASMSTEAIIEAINGAEPDFVVVALGAAKGQDWIEWNKDRLSAPVVAHLGAVVDFMGGAVARAPRIVTRAGFEWLWRIGAEPALWRRYARDGASLASLAAQRLLPQLRLRDRKNGHPAFASLETEGGYAVIRLKGDIGRSNLSPVREAFRKAARQGRPTILDLSGAGVVDRAFLGLALILEKHLAKAGSELSVCGLSPRTERLFRSNAMAYATARPNESAIRAPQAATA